LYDNHQPKYPRYLTSNSELKDCYMDIKGDIYIT
jgi:hypothetical protein